VTTTGLLCCTVEERAAHLAGLYHAVLVRPTVDRSNIFGVACPRSKTGSPDWIGADGIGARWTRA